MTEERMLRRSHTVRGATVEEVAIWCIEKQLDPKIVNLAGVVNLWWESPETKKEAEMREKYEREHIARTEAWERKTLARLMEKYDVRHD